MADGQNSAGAHPRYRKLGYVALAVTDVDRSRHYYETLIGLEVSGTGPGGEVFLRCSQDHHNIVLYPAATGGLRRIGFEMESEAELDHLIAIAESHGLSPSEVADDELAVLHQGRSIRFVEPITGAPLEFFVGQQSDLDFTPSVARIQRLGHVVLSTPNYEAAVDFFLDTLNFRKSDAIGERVTFMRCFPNPYHHSFGIARFPSAGVHHVNFMVSEIDDIGKALWRMPANGSEIVYGPGRHPPSNSVFLYFNDPDGITCEYSFGMEEFPEHAPRAPRPLAQVQASSDSWGCPPPRITPVRVSA